MKSKNLKPWLAVAIAMTIGVVARADDELLSILGGDQGSAKAAKAAAGPLREVLKNPTAEQNIFLQFVEGNELEKALYQWPTAFAQTSFASTSSGRALNSWLLFKNGLNVTALESLLAIEKPEEIAQPILTLWKEAAPDTHPAWSLVTSGWKPKWTEIFGVAAEVRVRSRQVYSSPSDIEQLKELIKKTQVDTRERAWLSWQTVVALASGDDAGTAGKALAVLMKSPNNPVSQDLMMITAARLLYQNGFLDASIKYYEKVPKASDDWFDAQEEMAWAHVRKGEPQNAIAITRTLMIPEFASQVGPETLFLRSLAQLKVCDYPEVVGTLNLFRERYKERAKKLMALSEDANNEVVQRYIKRAKAERLTLRSLGKDSAGLPRFITRDEVLLRAIETEKALEKEGKQAGDLYARSLTGGTGQVGFQARLEEFKKSVEARVASGRAATYNRIKQLANDEVNEISAILQKLHIVEAEVLQQISLADRVAGATANQKIAEKSGSTGSHAADRIWFPAEKETWFDELANYRVDVKKGCQAVKR